MRLFLDSETYSVTPINYGTYRYVQDCELMVVPWAVDDGPVQCWDATAGDAAPYELRVALREALRSCDEVVAHNAMFDRNVINKHIPKSAPPLAKWRCTMVQAMAHSLPGGLDKLCDLLGVPSDLAKHKHGKQLVQLFCKPRPLNHKLRRATRLTHPAEWAAFLEYAMADIEAMREVYKRLPSWNYQGAELALWHLDQRINDRGFAVDLDLANSAMDAAAREQGVLAVSAHQMTGGEVQRATQRDAMLDHIAAEYGVILDDLKGSTLERLLDDDTFPEPLKALLRVRQQASTTSTSKYKRVVNGATDGRLRGTLQFDGAGRTGRWSGRTFQPQNLPRPTLSQADIDFGIKAIKTGAADLIAPNVMELISSAIRGVIVAPEGKKLVVADLSNIEGRMLAWLADETWKLQAFRDFDAGAGADLYKLAYAKSFGVHPSEVDKAQRQIGKVQELALGYEGGVGAFLTFSLAYGIDLEAMARDAWHTLPEDLLRKSGEFYAWILKRNGNTYGLSREAFITCDVFKRGWRNSHRNVAALWKDLEASCVVAVQNPGQTLDCGEFKVRRDRSWLRIGLPSGRALCYPHPQVNDGKLSYMGVNQYTRQWTRLKTYGGKLVENATQAAARDVMASSMHAIEAAGYQIVLTVHDEILTEVPDTPDFSHQHLAALMSTTPAWAEGLPLAAAGFESYRYKKD
jgi:DNA polymerase